VYRRRRCSSPAAFARRSGPRCQKSVTVRLESPWLTVFPCGRGLARSPFELPVEVASVRNRGSRQSLDGQAGAAHRRVPVGVSTIAASGGILRSWRVPRQRPGRPRPQPKGVVHWSMDGALAFGARIRRAEAGGVAAGHSLGGLLEILAGLVHGLRFTDGDAFLWRR